MDFGFMCDLEISQLIVNNLQAFEYRKNAFDAKRRTRKRQASSFLRIETENNEQTRIWQ